MGSEAWSRIVLEDIKADQPNALATGPFGSSISAKYFKSTGVPVIRGSNLSDEVGVRLDVQNLVFLDPEKAKEFRRSIATRGDLIFTCWGTIGQVGLVDERSPYAEYVISNKQMKFRPNPKVANSLFLYYLFSGPEMSSRIRMQAIGSSVPGFNLSQLRQLSFPLPPLHEQASIAYVLGSLDNKIELNRRMNQTLETMARAIFKSWFVDFEPAREGSYPFPSTLGDSEIGSIPKGWDIGRFDDLLVLQRGFDLPSNRRSPGPYPVMAASGPSGTHSEGMVKGPGVTTGRSGVLGGVYLVFEDFWPLNTSLWVKDFRRSRPAHAYFLLQTLDLTTFNAGSAVPTLNRNHIHGLPMVVPPLPVIQRFEEKALPMLQLRHRKELESRTLASVRDTLLPKLLSGEIRVNQAEKIVGEVV